MKSVYWAWAEKSRLVMEALGYKVVNFVDDRRVAKCSVASTTRWMALETAVKDIYGLNEFQNVEDSLSGIDVLETKSS